jgi:hypothetical protein
MISADDRFAIADTLARYCFLLDTGHAERLAEEVFAADAELDYSSGLVVGRSAIDRFFAPYAGQVHTTAHFVSNVVVSEIGGETASTCYYQSWRWNPETSVFGPLRPADMVGIGAYDDRWTKTDAGWRIRRRSLRALGPGPIGVGRPAGDLAEMFAERARRAAAGAA